MTPTIPPARASQVWRTTERRMSSEEPRRLRTFQGLTRRRSLVAQLEYFDGGGQRTSRAVEPQALLLNPPVWYLLGWDRLRGAGRTFRLDGVESLTPWDESFLERAPETLMNDLSRFFRPL
jgi:predicted DNA-binding transcriptional regulator YafY